MTAAVKRQQDTTPAPVYAIFGEDAFLRQQALAQIVRNVLGDDTDQMAVAEFEGSSATLADVLDECRTPSLLAPIRLVCVLDADEFITAHRAALEDYLQKPSPTGVLVLVCRKWDKRWRLYKRVDEIGRNVACETPKTSELPAWLVRRTREAHGCTLRQNAARRLLDLVGAELGHLDMELAKLATYVSPKDTIRQEDVDQLVGATRLERVFGITDAIARRDASRALEMWDQVLATDRDAPYRAVGGLAYAFRRMAEAKRLLQQGLSPVQVARQVRAFGDAADFKRRLDQFSLRQWRHHLVQLLRIDMAAKTGLGTVRSAVEKLIVDACTAPRTDERRNGDSRGC